MAESPTKRVGKFTVLEDAESSASPFSGSEGPGKEDDEQKSASDSVDVFSLRTRQTTRRKSARQPKTPPQVVQAVSEAPADYKLWSQLLIGSANTVVITWLGTECAMERREAEMLEPPIARILARLTPEQSKQVSVFIDPMVMLIALGMWGNRIIRIQRAKRGVNGITDAEFARASGMAPVEETSGVETQPDYEPTVEPDLPTRTRVPINPNGIPVAITSQTSEI